MTISMKNANYKLVELRVEDGDPIAIFELITTYPTPNARRARLVDWSNGRHFDRQFDRHLQIGDEYREDEISELPGLPV